MPIYEFCCCKCGSDFEELLFGSDTAVNCPGCGSAEVSRKMSTFGMSGVEKPFAGKGAGCSSCSSSKCSSCG